MQTALVCESIFNGDEFLKDQALVIDKGRIIDILPAAQVSSIAHILDGAYLVPGFIDVQVNGGGGVLFNEQPTVATIKKMITAHRAYGTTALLPTLISSDKDTMSAAANAVQAAFSEQIAGLIGVHFEGPYLNPERCGVHNRELLRTPASHEFDFYSALSGQVMLTVAPEILSPGTIQRWVECGIIVCAGHTAASYAELKSALAEGLRGVTHLFNAMSQFGSREPGVVGCALDDEHCYCPVIVDGHHVHAASLRVAVRAKTSGKVFLVTDAMATVGTQLQAFTLDGQRISNQHGCLRTEQGVLAGSSLNMATAMANAVNLLELPLAEALRMASLYPAQFLRLDHERGRIDAGYRADLVLLDKHLNVIQTWIAGCASDTTL